MDPLEKINELRSKVDEIDRKIVELLNERTRLVREIIKIKKENRLSLYDPKREEEIFEKIRNANPGDLYNEALIDIYETILKWMKSLADEEY
ncbi:MAG: chorismate mutase [Actinobacteria bacterium]|nr:chorismate mutase [Actinomycetota bacterium]